MFELKNGVCLTGCDFFFSALVDEFLMSFIARCRHKSQAMKGLVRRCFGKRGVEQRGLSLVSDVEDGGVR